MKRISALLVAASLSTLFLFAFAPRSASASGYGYICSVYYNDYNNAAGGSRGYVRYTIYSQPLCAGSYLSYGYFNTTGGHSSCGYSNYGALDAAAAAQKEATLAEQAARGNKVYFWTSNNCSYRLNLYPMP